MTNLNSILKSRDITLPTKVCLVKAVFFPVVMYGCELDHKEGWAWKNCCFWTVVLEKTLESTLVYREIKPVNPKEKQPWIFNGRTDAKADAPNLWPHDAKSWLIGKDPDAEKDRRQEKETAEGEMVRSHQRLNGHEFEQTLRDSKGQGSLVCCIPWGCKESGTTWKLKQKSISVFKMHIMMKIY